MYTGDKVDFYAESFTRSYGGFFQTEYNNSTFNVYLNIAISNSEFNRIDHFNFLRTDPQRETGWKRFTSTTLKFGVNYNIDEIQNVYLNYGNFSRAPLSFNVYDWNNNLYENVQNESINSVELGYGFRNSFSKINLNYYYTVWDDKALSQSFLNEDSTSLYYYNIFGASAIHTGIELDASISISRIFSLSTAISYSSNKWESDIDAYIRPESNPTDEIKYKAFTNDLYVGNYPMTCIALGLDYRDEIDKDITLYFNPIYNFYGRYYAQFLPEQRVDETDRFTQPWRIPDFYNIDIHTGIIVTFTNFSIKNLHLAFNIFNIFDKENIIDAIDGISHNAKSARVWYGNERWWSASITLGI